MAVARVRRYKVIRQAAPVDIDTGREVCAGFSLPVGMIWVECRALPALPSDLNCSSKWIGLNVFEGQIEVYLTREVTELRRDGGRVRFV